MKNFKYIAYAVVLGLVIFGIYKIASAPKVLDANVMSENGLHKHAHLTIIIDGTETIIPADIGVDGVMGANGDPMEMHTHATDGIIHMEFAGLVTKDQMQIKNFFRVWGQDFSESSIMGHKAGNGHTIKMYVNGVENMDFENYVATGAGTYTSSEGDVDDIKNVYQ